MDQHTIVHASRTALRNQTFYVPCTSMSCDQVYADKANLKLERIVLPLHEQAARETVTMKEV